MDRRNFIQYGGMAASDALLAKAGRAEAEPAAAALPAEAQARGAGVFPGGQVPVVTPNGSTLAWRLVDGVKVGHLVAQAVDHEFAPGMRAECWGYNGGTPGPTIEAVEGDKLRIYVTNRLP